MRKYLYVGVASGFALAIGVFSLTGVVWNAGWEARPPGTELASDLDLFIREFKPEVRQRLEAEHIFGPGADDNGLHQPGSARCFLQNAAPTDINANVGGLEQFNSAASADAGNDLNIDEIGAAVRDIGTGRCWFDLDGADNVVGTTDDNQLFTWSETGAGSWVAASARDVAGVSIGASNLIYNGSFEITDGTGITASVLCPLAATGGGWANLGGPPTCTYQDPTGISEGEGIAVNVTGAVGVDSGLQQTLAGLKASTVYVVRARANPTTAADTCDLSVTGGLVTPVTDTSGVGTAVYETMEVVVTTTAAPASLVVRLESNAVTDVCRWDEVTAFERDAVVTQPGIQVCRSTDASVTNDIYTTIDVPVDALVRCDITPPGPGYIIQVRGALVADNEGGSADALAVRLRQNCGAATTVDLKTGWAASDADSPNDFQDVVSIPVSFTNSAPTPGVTCIYTLEAMTTDAGGNPTWDRNIGDDGTDDFSADATVGASVVTWIEAALIPVR